VRAAIVYVLMNHKKHHGATGTAPRLDAFSSAAWFEGFSPRADRLVVTLRDALPTRTIPVVRPRTWLLRGGWRKRGLVAPEERPKA